MQLINNIVTLEMQWITGKDRENGTDKQRLRSLTQDRNKFTPGQFYLESATQTGRQGMDHNIQIISICTVLVNRLDYT